MFFQKSRWFTIWSVRMPLLFCALDHLDEASAQRRSLPRRSREAEGDPDLPALVREGVDVLPEVTLVHDLVRQDPPLEVRLHEALEVGQAVELRVGVHAVAEEPVHDGLEALEA